MLYSGPLWTRLGAGPAARAAATKLPVYVYIYI